MISINMQEAYRFPNNLDQKVKFSCHTAIKTLNVRADSVPQFSIPKYYSEIEDLTGVLTSLWVQVFSTSPQRDPYRVFSSKELRSSLGYDPSILSLHPELILCHSAKIMLVESWSHRSSITHVIIGKNSPCQNSSWREQVSQEHWHTGLQERQAPVRDRKIC